MNNFSGDIKINEKLNYIFKDRFDIDLFDNKKNIDINENLLGENFKLKARDLIYLLTDIELEFKITILEEDINNIKFNTINNIINIINDKLREKKLDLS
ncbi:peptide maturation system acyl carrier-related protein [Clostridium botulinum]|uniref:peptide maturation system acyl carrier-related protein n=1 Tax=Clostridium botulinum TaxID=1491 RepID=UPI0013FFD749|nr:peptide maturation system acyl carrier-related protein [Clostridium botulinum]MBY6914836.1 peptide maturation system acyl carrier-related protein [Clostridium botulinum]NFO38856.1 peptide maturation system acyl carrier-related protein [Clostridium botulinum]NFQ39703.1 peptide maturation system acyl carrier-related protein [Clostridium botulinum]